MLMRAVPATGRRAANPEALKLRPNFMRGPQLFVPLIAIATNAS
jgi:hypothetical protein